MKSPATTVFPRIEPKMNRKYSGLKILGLIIAVALSLTASLASTNMISAAQASASYSGQPKPMEFYLHCLDTPVDVAGLQTKYIANTTQWFRFQTQQEAHANSFYKPIGQPKIAVDFYLYPNLAGPVTLDGSWQVFLWVNGSAYKPTGFTLQFKEVTVGGTTLWDSGSVNPKVTSSIGEYIDVPVYAYNLTTELTHMFTVGTTIHTHIEVNAGSSADTRIWYDSSLYPSKVILPATDYARPVTVKTYAFDNSETNLFHRNWSDSQRQVIVRADVTDPFGGYDIYRVNMTLTDPAGNSIIDNAEMTRTSDGQWRVNYMHQYEATWSYPKTAQLGNYTVTVSVIDNNGYYSSLASGSFGQFIEFNDHVFSIGILTYYDPAFHIVDDIDAPLPSAQVYITWPNGTMDNLPRYTDDNGFINLTHVLPANYGFTILWKDIVVRQTSIYVDSDGPYTIKTEVYQLTVNVLGNNRGTVNGAYVIVYAESGVGYGLDITDTSGRATFKLPTGTYMIEAHFSSEYWLRVVATKATEPTFTLNTSMSKTMILEEFPPPIWATTGFWLIVAMVGVSVFAAIYIVYLSRRRVATAKKRA